MNETTLCAGSYELAEQELEKQLSCMTKVRKNIAKWLKGTVFIDMCLKYIYETSHWSRKWEDGTDKLVTYELVSKNQELQDYFKNFTYWTSIMEREPEKGIDMIINSDDFDKAFGQIRVKLNQANVKYFKYAMLESAVSLIGKIGGQFSLWLGLTVFGFAEIIRLFWDIGQSQLRQIMKKRNQQITDIEAGNY